MGEQWRMTKETFQKIWNQCPQQGINEGSEEFCKEIDQAQPAPLQSMEAKSGSGW